MDKTIVILVCASRKNVPSDSLVNNFPTVKGKSVVFVAEPAIKQIKSGTLYQHPDDVMFGSLVKTWRDFLKFYNDWKNANHIDPKPELNSFNLLEAAKLYKPKIYQQLQEKFGKENFFILSAGWGLIKSDFLIPPYDITFSALASKHYRRTKKNDRLFKDFCHLQQSDLTPETTIYFFGGKEYLPLLYKLTNDLKCKEKIIFYSSNKIKKIPGYTYKKYSPTGTNWHYNCAKELLK